MDLTKTRFIKRGNLDVFKVCKGETKAWPTFDDWDTIVSWPNQTELDNLALSDERQGHVMAVQEWTNGVISIFFIVVSLIYRDNNKGKIKIYSFNTETNVFREQSFTDQFLSVGYAAGDYYGKSIAWDKENAGVFIVGAPRTADYKAATGDGLIRIFEIKTVDTDNDIYTFGLRGNHYNWNGVSHSTTVNNTNGWIAGGNWEGSPIPSFGWSVALSANAQSAYVSAPALSTVLKRDFNSNLNIWTIINVGSNLTYGPDQFWYAALGTTDWFEAEPSYFGVEIFTYRNDEYLLEEFLVVRTAKNNAADNFFHNGVAVFKIRGASKDLEASRWRIIAFPDPLDNSKNLTFNWDDTMSNLRKSITCGDKAVIIGTPLNNTVYCFNQDTQIKPVGAARRDSLPWHTITFNSSKLTTGVLSVDRNFGSTVAASERSIGFGQMPYSTILISQVDHNDFDKRGAYSAYTSSFSNNIHVNDLFPLSQDVIETGNAQDCVGYCTFINSNNANYIISTTPEATVSFPGSVSKKSGKLTIKKRVPRHIEPE